MPLNRENAFAVRVDEIVFKGAFNRITLVTPGGVRLTAVATNESASREGLGVGDDAWAGIDAADILVRLHRNFPMRI